MLKKVSIAIFLALFSISSFAEEIKLITIEKSTDQSKSDLMITTDDRGDILKFTFIIKNKKNVEKNRINISTKEVKKGKVLLKKMGVKIIKARSENFEPHNGGNFTIDYLKKYRFIGSNSRGKIEFLIDREGDKWFLKKDGDKVLKLIANDHSKGIHKFEVIKLTD